MKEVFINKQARLTLLLVFLLFINATTISAMVASNAFPSPAGGETTNLQDGAHVQLSITTVSKTTSSLTSPISQSLPPLAAATANNGATRFYLIRHGETDWNVEGKIQGGGFDIPLNANGRVQAQMVAQELQNLPIGLVASSHLQRASETADMILTALQQQQQHPTNTIQRSIHKGLGEMSFGAFEGLAWRSETCDPGVRESILSISKQMTTDATVRFPGAAGETTLQVQERSLAVIKEIMEEHADQQHIVVVSHGRTNKVLLAALLYGNVLEYRHFKQSSECGLVVVAVVCVVFCDCVYSEHIILTF
jgi:broad specificity phosphatase PhoE